MFSLEGFHAVLGPPCEISLPVPTPLWASMFSLAGFHAVIEVNGGEALRGENGPEWAGNGCACACPRPPKTTYRRFCLMMNVGPTEGDHEWCCGPLRPRNGKGNVGPTEG